MSPSGRAAAHAAKIKSRENRKANNPGPGSYETLQKGKTGNRTSSAFKSNSKRLGVEDVYQGDPGAYDPYATQELAQTTKSTFQRSNRSGEGGFGTKATREMKQEIMGKDTPGPGAYSGKSPQADSRVKMPSSAFRSSSQQRSRDHSEDTPGVGSYQPSTSAVEAVVKNSGSGMRGKGERFKAETQTTEDAIGPCSYSADCSASGRYSTISAATQKNAAMGSAMFNSDYVRDLPY